MDHDWKIIADALRHEIAEYGGLLHLFEEQQRYLFARNPDGVLRLSGEIESLVQSLHESRRNREALVAAFATEHSELPTATLRTLLPHFAADVRPLLEALISEINILIHRVRRTSRHNHSLLSRTVEAQKELLRQLRPDSFTQTYAPSGRATLGGVRPEPAFRVAG